MFTVRALPEARSSDMSVPFDPAISPFKSKFSEAPIEHKKVENKNKIAQEKNPD